MSGEDDFFRRQLRLLSWTLREQYLHLLPVQRSLLDEHPVKIEELMRHPACVSDCRGPGCTGGCRT